jgi:hypothetical protein
VAMHDVGAKKAKALQQLVNLLENNVIKVLSEEQGSEITYSVLPESPPHEIDPETIASSNCITQAPRRTKRCSTDSGDASTSADRDADDRDVTGGTNPTSRTTIVKVNTSIQIGLNAIAKFRAKGRTTIDGSELGGIFNKAGLKKGSKRKAVVEYLIMSGTIARCECKNVNGRAYTIERSRGQDARLRQTGVNPNFIQIGSNTIAKLRDEGRTVIDAYELKAALRNAGPRKGFFGDAVIQHLVSSGAITESNDATIGTVYTIRPSLSMASAHVEAAVVDVAVCDDPIAASVVARFRATGHTMVSHDALLLALKRAGVVKHRPAVIDGLLRVRVLEAVPREAHDIVRYSLLSRANGSEDNERSHCQTTQLLAAPTCVTDDDAGGGCLPYAPLQDVAPPTAAQSSAGCEPRSAESRRTYEVLISSH